MAFMAASSPWHFMQPMGAARRYITEGGIGDHLPEPAGNLAFRVDPYRAIRAEFAAEFAAGAARFVEPRHRGRQVGSLKKTCAIAIVVATAAL